MRFFDMFAGVGGFHLGIQRAFLCDTNKNLCRSSSTAGSKERQPKQLPELSLEGLSCIGYSEIDKYAIKVYERHFGNDNSTRTQPSEQEGRGRKDSDKLPPQADSGNTKAAIGESAGLHNRNKRHANYGDATTINPSELPDFDLLVGGFPCQAFSIAGKRKGFDEARGTLFFDIARILKHKRPRHLVLENVKGLLSHDSGKTFQTILGILADLGYRIEWQVLNSKDFGVPQNRERIFIVGHLRNECTEQIFPIGESGAGHGPKTGQETETSQTYIATKPSIKQINGNPEDYSCLKCEGESKASHGLYCPNDIRIRQLTPKECERLQGFPDGWTKKGVRPSNPGIDDTPQLFDISDSQRYKMLGNAVTVNVVEAVMTKLIPCLTS